ncbi:DUF3325 domain-containing protein [Pollutimonas bauzanensis]|uniref:DUF3325 domain-containing protein n=1 Tax=Pollutimonas bauzanensis TaxID=658167 RepID=A0A1M5QMJ3_9BURK|nr:DUF3325 domain-containing protein [Pollutimonas bauzanensis]SHH14950.1 Protein of unknown function [Pollutimonas bauzanensis]
MMPAPADLWSHAAVLGLSIVAFALLALAMERHQEAVFGRRLGAAAGGWNRAAGWAALALALVLAVALRGWSLGLVAFSGHASLAAGIVYGMLVWQGRRKAPRRHGPYRMRD